MGSGKGLSTMLWIVIAAVMAIVVALVLLAMFGRGILPIGTLADFKQQCETTGRLSCQTTGYLPVTWKAVIYIDEKPASCEIFYGEGKTCENLDWKVEAGS